MAITLNNPLGQAAAQLATDVAEVSAAADVILWGEVVLEGATPGTFAVERGDLIITGDPGPDPMALDPDCSGVYKPIDDYDGFPAWKHATKNWWVFIDAYGEYYVITPELGRDFIAEDSWHSFTIETPYGTYISWCNILGTAVGTLVD